MVKFIQEGDVNAHTTCARLLLRRYSDLGVVRAAAGLPQRGRRRQEDGDAAIDSDAYDGQDSSDEPDDGDDDDAGGGARGRSSTDEDEVDLVIKRLKQIVKQGIVSYSRIKFCLIQEFGDSVRACAACVRCLCCVRGCVGGCVCAKLAGLDPHCLCRFVSLFRFVSLRFA